MPYLTNTKGFFSLPSTLRLCAGLLIALGAIDAKANVPASERAVLDAIYSGTGGPTWTVRWGWGLPPSDYDECSSHGVTCVTDAQGQEHVSGIDLSNNGLTGQLPPSLSGLPYLQNFVVYDNQIGGSIPTLTGLTNLQNFDVDTNQLTGPIPSLAGLASLEYFDIDDNQLTGSIPSLSGLTNL
ncbi:MAG TPA: hypothetical protein VHE32_09980, partial [Rhodanobacteraceae bacterium]|nr:hypothetical protein [Rhodanobacteraceae bacterium]